MKKLASLLTAALFALTAALPVSAAPADDSLAIVPATAPAATGIPPRFSCFVTGTDTEIGKTLVSGAILHTLVSAGVRACDLASISSGVPSAASMQVNPCWLSRPFSRVREAPESSMTSALGMVVHDRHSRPVRCCC